MKQVLAFVVVNKQDWDYFMFNILGKEEQEDCHHQDLPNVSLPILILRAFETLHFIFTWTATNICTRIHVNKAEIVEDKYSCLMYINTNTEPEREKRNNWQTLGWQSLELNQSYMLKQPVFVKPIMSILQFLNGLLLF